MLAPMPIAATLGLGRATEPIIAPMALSLNGNAMIGNLQCKENLPAPTGSDNVATSKEDQCRAL